MSIYEAWIDGYTLGIKSDGPNGNVRSITLSAVDNHELLGFSSTEIRVKSGNQVLVYNEQGNVIRTIG